MHLRYDYYTRRYLGERYSVSETAFLEALQAMIIAGREPEDALAAVLDEAAWNHRMPGVALLPPHPACRCCGNPLPPLHQTFCSAVCEAAYVAATGTGGLRRAR